MKNILINIIKEIYLLFVHTASKIPTKKRAELVFLVSFPETSGFLIEKLYKAYGNKLVLCYTHNSKNLVVKYKQQGCKALNIDSIWIVLFKISPLLRKSKIILCDNYFALLGGIEFQSDVSVVQLWHANGAIKKFGIEANYAKKMSKKDHKRYQSVYNKFTHFIVSSKKMGDIFLKSFRSNGELLRFGYPLTDYYYENTKNKNHLKYKMGNKKVLLYAPTYRESNYPILDDLLKLKEKKEDEWILIVHPHPRDHFLSDQIKKSNIIHPVAKDMSLPELFQIADCLITDYSSAPFEYSLANPKGKVIFFCYDLDSYEETTGLQDDFKRWAHPIIVQNIDELLNSIESEEENGNKIINDLWNEYSNGNAVKQLIEWIDKKNGYRNHNGYSC